jgi:hypothetical protein
MRRIAAPLLLQLRAGSGAEKANRAPLLERMTLGGIYRVLARVTYISTAICMSTIWRFVPT